MKLQVVIEIKIKKDLKKLAIKHLGMG